MSRVFVTGPGPTGADLYDELCVAAAAAGVTTRKFAAPLFSEPNWKLEQLQISKRPTPSTIARVRALIAGEPLPPTRAGNVHFGMTRAQAEAAGLPASRASQAQSNLAERATAEKARVELARHMAERAHAERLPGETLAAAVKRLARQQSTVAALGGHA